MKVVVVPREKIFVETAPVSNARQQSDMEQLQPIRVYENGHKDVYYLIDGRGRVNEGDQQDPPVGEYYAIVEKNPTVERQALVSLATNLSGRDNPMQDAIHLGALLSLKDENDKPLYTQSSLAKKIGIKQPTISRRLGLLDLIEDFQTMLLTGELAINAGYALAKLPPAKQEELAADGQPLTIKEAKAAGKEHRSDSLALDEIDIPDLDDTPMGFYVNDSLARALLEGKVVEIEGVGKIRMI
jgi:hypothetical protein